MGMISIDELRERLSQWLDKTNESQNSVAKRLNIQQSSLSTFLAGKKGLALEPALLLLQDMGARIIFPGQTYAPLPEADTAQTRKLEQAIARLAEQHEKDQIALAEMNLLLEQQARELGTTKDKLIHALEEISELKDQLADRPLPPQGASGYDTANPRVK